MRVPERADAMRTGDGRTDGTLPAGSLIERVLQDPMVEVLIRPDKPRFEFIEHNLGILRDENTQQEEFRATADRLFQNLGAYLAESLPITVAEARTPTGATYKKEAVDGSGVLLVAILRSGFPMVEGIADAMPGVQTATVDMKRIEKEDEITGETTSIPKIYYDGLPKGLSKFQEILVPDPMIATGGSTIETIEMLIAKGALEERIHIVGLVSAAEGILAIRKKYPKVKITTCALDTGLNKKNFIMPGLGDFGNRYYGMEGRYLITDERSKKWFVYQDCELTDVVDFPTTVPRKRRIRIIK